MSCRREGGGVQVLLASLVANRRREFEPFGRLDALPDEVVAEARD
jgi:hypothetical protein